jgi:hypothetical protein
MQDPDEDLGFELNHDDELDLDDPVDEVEGGAAEDDHDDEDSRGSINHRLGEEGTLVDEDEGILETYYPSRVDEISLQKGAVAEVVDVTAPTRESLTMSPKRKKKRDLSSLRKAPQAPKRFKSSYICFFTTKQPGIKENLGDKATVTEISKRSAQMWKSLSQEDRAYWDDVAAKDKQRYMVEKASYTGPWQIPFKRAKKDPTAPKRPMSAFLHFSQGKRSKIKEKQPEIKNTEVSRLLGEMWRNCSEDDRKPYVEKEKKERGVYKMAMAEWKVEFEKRKEEEHNLKQQQQHDRQHQLEEARQLTHHHHLYMAAQQGHGAGSGQHGQQYPQTMPFMPHSAHSIPQGYMPYPPAQMYAQFGTFVSLVLFIIICIPLSDFILLPCGAASYHPQPSPHHQYTGSKPQPVVLGPNGLPLHYQTAQYPHQQPTFMYHPPPLPRKIYDDPHAPISVAANETYEIVSSESQAPAGLHATD